MTKICELTLLPHPHFSEVQLSFPAFLIRARRLLGLAITFDRRQAEGLD